MNQDDDEGPASQGCWKDVMHPRTEGLSSVAEHCKCSVTISDVSDSLSWAFTGEGSTCVLRDVEAGAETNGCDW